MLDVLGAVIDHKEAHSKTGDDSDQNLFAACNKCNTRKSDGESEKFREQEKFKYVKGQYGEPQNWDGLVSLFILLSEKYSSDLTPTEKHWLKAFNEFFCSQNLHSPMKKSR
ncbi:MAG: HNH endonuclease [Chloroflexi bacterium]|nr:HNH endonuclease [Chloroflexota bacterium]